MLWFTVWVLLALATCGGAFLLGRRLWRSGNALLAELGRAADVTSRLESLQAELAVRFPEPAPPRPDLGAGPEDVTRFRAVRAAHREAARRRRTARLDRAMRHWRSLVAPR